MTTTRRNWLGGMGAAALGAGLGLHGGRAHAAAQWKLATGYKPETFHTRNVAQFAQEASAGSGGALAIDVFPNNSLARLADIFAAVQSGQAQAGEVLMSGIATQTPLAGADAVPFVVSSYADAQRLWTHQKPLIEAAFAPHGLVPLYAVPWPPQGLFTVRPVRSRADFRGLKMRTYNPTTVRIAELLGAVPVDVAAPDIPAALASGRIEAMITSSATGAESRIWTHARYYYELNAWIPKNLVFARRESIDALPEPARKALSEAAWAAEVRGWAMSEEALQSAVAELRSNGMAVERIAPDLARELGRLGERFSREWVRTVGHGATRLFVPFYTRS